MIANTGAPFADGPPPAFCRLALHEETVELEDAKLETDLARSRFEAYVEIFKLIEELWNSDAIERMIYLQAKYDRDAAELSLERAALRLDRQVALIEQYRLMCDADAEDDRQAIEQAHRRYRGAHCTMLVKDLETAEVNLEFNRVLLASVQDLRAGKVATRQDVIRAELDVELEEKRLATAKKRVAVCTEELSKLTGAD